LSYHGMLASTSVTVIARWCRWVCGTSAMGVSLRVRAVVSMGTAVGEVHVDGVVDEIAPSRAVGVVGDLLVAEARRQGGPEVDVARLGDAVGRETLPRSVECTHGRRERLGRRFEARDRALEQQLVARRVRGAELHEAPEALDEHAAWVTGRVRLG